MVLNPLPRPSSPSPAETRLRLARPSKKCVSGHQSWRRWVSDRIQGFSTSIHDHCKTQKLLGKHVRMSIPKVRCTHLGLDSQSSALETKLARKSRSRCAFHAQTTHVDVTRCAVRFSQLLFKLHRTWLIPLLSQLGRRWESKTGRNVIITSTHRR